MTAAESTPRASTLARDVAEYLGRSLMPVETYVSLPVPVMRDGLLAAAFFGAIAVTRADETNEDLYAPCVHVRVDWNLSERIDHTFIRAVRPVSEESPIATVRPPAFAGRIDAALEERLSTHVLRLDALLDLIAPLFPRAPQTAEERETISAYLAAFTAFVPPALMPAYEALNPDFFDWLRANRIGGAAETRACLQCGTRASAGGRFCGNCGAAIPDH